MESIALPNLSWIIFEQSNIQIFSKKKTQEQTMSARKKAADDELENFQEEDDVEDTKNASDLKDSKKFVSMSFDFFWSLKLFFVKGPCCYSLFWFS